MVEDINYWNRQSMNFGSPDKRETNEEKTWDRGQMRFDWQHGFVWQSGESDYGRYRDSRIDAGTGLTGRGSTPGGNHWGERS